MDLRLAGGGDVPKQLENLYNELSAYCKLHHLQLHLDSLTRSLLDFAKDSDYPVGCSGGDIWSKFCFLFIGTYMQV